MNSRHIVLVSAVVICLGLAPVLLVVAAPTAAETNPTAAAATETKVWLADLPEIDAHVGYGALGKNKEAGFDNERIVFSLVPAEHGLGMHPDGSVSFQLDKKYKTFNAAVAINDSARGRTKSPVFFQVEADGKLIYESRGIQLALQWQPVYLDVSGVERLTLKTLTKGGDFSWAHAIWLDPYVASSAPDPELLKVYAPSVFKQFDQLIEFREHVRDLFKDEKFDELEKLAAESRSKKDFLGGEPRMWWYYEGLAQLSAPTEAAMLEHIDRASAWQKKFPKSCIPAIVAANDWMEFAFAARGGGYAGSVTEKGWQLFRERCAKGRALLDEAEKLPEKDAHLYYKLVDFARCQDTPRADAEAIVEKGIQLDPTYYPLYQSMTVYLLPRWGGAEGDVPKFAQSVRKRIGGETGDIAYGAIAMFYGLYEGFDAVNKEFPYEDLKPALVARYEKFPYLLPDAHRTAWFACSNNDPATAHRIFERLPIQQFLNGLWLYDMRTMASARRWAAQDPTKHEEIRTLFEQGKTPRCMALSGDGKTLVTGYQGLEFWDVASGKITRHVDVPGQVQSLAWNPKNSQLLVSNVDEQENGDLYLCDADSGALGKPIAGHSKSVVAASVTPDGKLWATGSLDRSARAWSPDLPNLTITMACGGPVWGVAISPDGSQLCTGTVDGELMLWDARTGARIGTRMDDPAKAVPQPIMHFLPDGDHLLLGGHNGTMQLWDLKAKTVRSVAGGNEIFSVAVSPDGRFFAVGRMAGGLELYETATLRKVHDFSGHWAMVTALAFSADGQTLISGAFDHCIKFWDLKPWIK